jgi:hypothetical protein
MTPLQRLAGATIVVLMLTACGGGAGESATPSTETVQGVTTPSSVSVVTAKNAQ